MNPMQEGLIFRDIMEFLTALFSLFAAVTVVMNRKQINELHVQINSRMDQLLMRTTESATAVGRSLEAADRKREKIANGVEDIQNCVHHDVEK